MRAKVAGFTLVEVVVAVTILLIALSVALALYVQGTLMYKRQEIGVEVQENARIALDRLVRELRTAREINEVRATSITFTLDDGSQVRYYHDTSRQQLMRQKGGGVNPLASYIRDLRFEGEPPGASQGVLIKITLVAGEGEGRTSTFTTSVFVR